MDEDVEALRKKLTDADPFTRAIALDETIAILRQKRLDPALSEPLVPLVRDPDVEVRRKATWALGRLALGKKGADRSLDALVDGMEDEDEEVRENSAWALGELAGIGIGTKDAIPGLNRLLSDQDRQVVGMAAWALGRMAERLGLSDPSSVPLLKALEQSPSDYVRKGAAWALQRVLDQGTDRAET